MTVGRPITAGRSRDRCVSNVVSNPISDAARAPSPLYRARGQRRPSAASGLPIRNDFGTLSRVDRFQHGESQVKRFREEKRERFLSDVEYQRLGAALKAIEVDSSETASAIAAVRLLMLTGCRLSEIQKLLWEHVDLGASELRLPDTKTGAKVVYLGDPAIAVLERIDRRDGNPWVIAGRKPGSHLTDLQHPWRRIRARAELDDVRIHDLRHSCASSPYRLASSTPTTNCNIGPY